MHQFPNYISDEQLMGLALRLGRRGAGLTAENPAVGCVIVRHGKDGAVIVGRGWTQQGGRPHAERVALAEAGNRAQGATAYVTLEPCSHHGKSSPCAEALIEAGIANLVCAHPDPDPRVAGRGFALLTQHAIKTTTGLLEKQAHRDLCGFLSRTVRGRPWLQVKMALSLDGMIGEKNVGNFPITGPEAKARTYGLRARADAILVGVETVLVDDPSLTVRLSGLNEHSPIRIVLDSKGRTPLDSQLVQSANDVPVWIVTTGAIAADKALALESQGCQVLLVDQDANGHTDLTQTLDLLGEKGINKILAECGAVLSRALLNQSLVDEFFLYRSTKLVGENGLVALNGDPDKTLEHFGFTADRKETLGKDTMQVYIRANSLSELYKGK
ncbi:bifunctional diaminohydroxyphosphoribosylaminopyrimidine deaminase/5-amino-6-(5-phosphoribosylamino)uracil reductase RibD [Cohaesibacter celericrescens]|nr:bifunctional diaminohydroxyphosphoribosylaminopyrimidine deaminase/5-amino-6-(5-phosphoribosylamino)uracil reductase RibD [Cohaesibacter celericrescens]